MTFRELRRRHPRLTYEAYEIKKKPGELVIRQHFTLEPDIYFSPETRIPADHDINIAAIRPFVFHLGLVEAISYWKAACPPEFVVKAGALSQDQIAWWHDLFLHGLGEFFYKNDIDFTQKDFLRISSALGGSPFNSLRQGPTTSSPFPLGAKAVTELEKTRLPAPATLDPLKRDLVLVGGGKDSAVTLGLLAASGRRIGTLAVNPTQSALDNVRAAGLTEPLVVKRTIDPKLLELNRAGYLNGHTPFSAYLAFLGTFVATLHGFGNVIVSNERSANEGNVVYRGMEVNHQYSKSYRFEQLFREYASTYLVDPRLRGDEVINYFSFLRPLNDLQISLLFSRLPQFFSTFRSCNVGQKTNSWCGACAKCAFAYMTLFPFVDYEQMLKMFGVDYYTKPEIVGWIQQLVGLTKHKPFECVGTKDEAMLALALSITRYQSLGKEVPAALLNLEKELKLDTSTIEKLKKTVAKGWNNEHVVPESYMNILKKAVSRAQRF